MKRDDSPEGIRKWMTCKPRSTHELLRRFGLRWRDHLPEGTMMGVDCHGYVHYWIPPQRASKPFEKKLGTLDVTSIQLA